MVIVGGPAIHWSPSWSPVRLVVMLASTCHDPCWWFNDKKFCCTWQLSHNYTVVLPKFQTFCYFQIRILIWFRLRNFLPHTTGHHTSGLLLDMPNVEQLVQLLSWVAASIPSHPSVWGIGQGLLAPCMIPMASKLCHPSSNKLGTQFSGHPIWGCWVLLCRPKWLPISSRCKADGMYCGDGDVGCWLVGNQMWYTLVIDCYNVSAIVKMASFCCREAHPLKAPISSWGNSANSNNR